jgi:hypothetical protein
VALFREVGDRLFAANTLFIMAQRSMQAGISDDDVHRWLSESRDLAEGAGSEDDTVHATVGFGQLAWLRGDHPRAAALMADCLPTLRRTGDRRCMGRALYVLGARAHEDGDLATGQELLRGCVEAVAVAGQSLVLVQALETLAAVLADQDQPREAATLLGAADTVREEAGGQPNISPSGEEVRRTVRRSLGESLFTQAHRHGAQLSPTQALRQVYLHDVDGHARP